MKKVLVMILVLFAFGCSNDATEPSENTLVGKWESVARFGNEDNGNVIILTYVLEFSNDGRYSAYDLTEDKEFINIEGTYSISNDSLTTLNKECQNIEAMYRVIFDGDEMRIETIKNECESNQSISGLYSKHNYNN